MENLLELIGNYENKDDYIYERRNRQELEQIKREKELPDLPAPELWINPDVRDFFEIDNSKDIKDVKVKDEIDIYLANGIIKTSVLGKEKK